MSLFKPSIVCRLCWTCDNLALFRDQQNNDKNIPPLGAELQHISKTKTARSQNPLKQFCSFSSCKRRDFLQSSVAFVEQNITGLSLFLYARFLGFFPLNALQ